MAIDPNLHQTQPAPDRTVTGDTDEYQAIRGQAGADPSRHLRWQDVIRIDPSISRDAERNGKLTASLDHIAATDTGQQELRAILLQHDKPLTIALRSGGRPGENYIDENGIHRMEMHSSVFDHDFQPSEFVRSFNQNLVHELGHGASPFPNPHPKTNGRQFMVAWAGRSGSGKLESKVR